MFNYSTLVVGYGSSLRRDDVLGLKISSMVASWNLIGVKVLRVHQLTFELAYELSLVEKVILIDAASNLDSQVKLEQILASDTQELFTHGCSPSGLIAISQWLYGKAPEVWLLQINAEDFSLGRGISPKAKQGITAGLKILYSFLTGVLCTR